MSQSSTARNVLHKYQILYSSLLLPSFALLATFCSKNSVMHPKYEQAQLLSRDVIGAGVEVHRILGPGLLESIYEKCLMRELELRGFRAINQDEVQIEFKGEVFTEELRFDVLVEDCLLVEVKAVQEVHPIHKAKLLSYMKLLDIPLGLIMNFHEVRLVDGISRMILRGADATEAE